VSWRELAGDQHAHLASPVHRWEPRCKFAGLMTLLFAFSFVQELRLLPAMLAVAFGLYALSRLPLSYAMDRLRYPGFFLLAVLIMLPFLSGSTVILRIGPLALRQEGCLAVLLIGARFISILTVGIVLFGTMPFLTTIKAMRALGLPAILADMTLLAYRYLHEIGSDLARTQTAMGLRGFKAHGPSGRTLGVLASLAGSLLVRSYERSERVYHAMALRGYGRAPQRWFSEFRTGSGDVVALGGVLLVAIGFVAAELLWGRFGG
jgi:cobalt/nickel transport system permease protein